MPIRIGANPIGWSNDDLQDIGGATPLETCLAEAREAGFVGMELGHKFPREPKALKAALDPFGMACISGWYSAELLKRDADEEMKHLRPHLDLLKAMGSTVLVFAETSNAIHGDRSKPLSQRPVMAAGDWAQFGRRITEVAERTLAEGVRLVYHHHMGTIVESEADIDAFMAATGEAAHLLLDTGHATWGGADPVKLAERYRARISHVHAKDVRKGVMEQARREDWSFLDAILGKGRELGVYTVPGDGMVDYPAVFKALPGYSGWVVVEAEQDPEKAHPLTYAKKGVAHLKQSLKEAGLV
ncbi:Rhizopine catabolism protein MocC [Bosea sp. 62]|uniref:myo-inosose-2 dehydratase n=1 Tax=unclassified Bosea (in: a-proteobacteria) TaxID=2653178 RepID=UPI00125643FF|nr:MULTISPECIES: myo-inosose-2 dehydratase [unclassified Bosea (in: a-proteobacteria)]CAD5251282.1 Rhizopine catabolism protein MocC [Bosea sp. 21B]CAD5262224.1 Rhizopine catabolism protein MocC [Bosea sp. 7B]CAD5272422.1 Rhizopine catabolism protein MocC [Bosea sp. 46]VVT43640.1 Rhizopine catabolism protein MocC [Bosea sp. EC-HK365B]VXB22521.1 Rhizopine catabolism protein MocC [Bosea sp. 29B]